MRKIALSICLFALFLTLIPVMAQDQTPPGSRDLLALVISALLWATFSIIISQVVSIGALWWLGLPPRKLIREIEEVQNPAIGACFFIISLIASFFIGFMATDGFTPDPPGLESAAWIIGGIILSFAYTALVFVIAHRVMGRENNESVYAYIRREVVLEQNSALAFFLGGLAVSPFISIVFQLL